MQSKVTKRNLENQREREREREREINLQGGTSFLGYGVIWHLCGGILST